MASFYDLQGELDKEILRLQKELMKLDPSTDEYKKIANELEKLYEMRMKQHQADVRLESDEQEKKAERELREREIELNDSKAKAERELREREIELNDSKAKAEGDFRERELAFSKQRHRDELNESKKDRHAGWLRIGVEVGLTVLQVGGTIVCTAMMLGQGYEFERTGSPTSTTFREARKSISDAIRNLTHHKR